MSFSRTIIASLIMLLTIVSIKYLRQSEMIPPNKPFTSFPMTIGEWKGVESRFDQEIYTKLGVDDSILANYISSEDRQVQLYVGYYQSQKEGDLIHSPKHCMPGGGWSITKTSIEDLNFKNSNPKIIRTIKLELEKSGEQQIVLYWFQSRGRFVSSEYWQKIYLVIDSITKRRTDGSFVRLIAPVVNNDKEKALADLKDFAAELIPILQGYIPS